MRQRRLRAGMGMAVAASVVLAGALPGRAAAQELVYLVRHAERADQAAPGQQMQAQTDPPLSPEGQARAKRLADMLRDAGVEAVYATEYRRTADTVQPLASALGLDVQVNPARETEKLVARLRAEHPRGIVVVAGHSNTVPEIIKALGGPDLTIGEREYDNLFIFAPATRTLSRIRY